MARYILKRLLQMIPVLLGITFLVYVILSIAPGDPAEMILGSDATPAMLAAKRAELGLDQPFFVQYVRYILNVCQGDFGTSWIHGTSILDDFMARLPNTLTLGVLALLFSTVFGIIFGVIAAVRQYSVFDYATLAAAMVISALPAFWVGLLAQIAFCLNLGWLPPYGNDTIVHYILPAITLGAAQLGGRVRLTRSCMLDVIKQDYVRTARAKGANEPRVIMKHVFRNGLMQVITSIGMGFATIMGGAVVTETVFAIPGTGSMMVNAVKSRDIPVVMCVLIFIAVFIGIVNLLVDIIYAWVDPRVKLG